MCTEWLSTLLVVECLFDHFLRAIRRTRSLPHSVEPRPRCPHVRTSFCQPLASSHGNSCKKRKTLLDARLRSEKCPTMAESAQSQGTVALGFLPSAFTLICFFFASVVWFNRQLTWRNSDRGQASSVASPIHNGFHAHQLTSIESCELKWGMVTHQKAFPGSVVPDKNFGSSSARCVVTSST